MLKRWVTTILLVGAATAAPSAENWPQWRGPLLNGISNTKTLPTNIANEDGTTVVVKAGPTFQVLVENNFDDYTLSSPAISDGQIFIRTAKFLYAIGTRATGTQ